MEENKQEIIKICKIHGELTKDKTYFKKDKYNGYLQCKYCLALTTKKYREKNKAKVSESLKKHRDKIKKSILNNDNVDEVLKICKKHGSLSKILVTHYGECRKCKRESNKLYKLTNKEKLKEKSLGPEFKTTRKNWRNKNKERVNEQLCKWRKKQIDELSDWYLKKSLRQIGLTNNYIPNEVLEIKKIQILIYRKLKKQREK